MARQALSVTLRTLALNHGCPKSIIQMPLTPIPPWSQHKCVNRLLGTKRSLKLNGSKAFFFLLYSLAIFPLMQ